jgi:ATP-dependent protease Clp ATPase subunit
MQGSSFTYLNLKNMEIIGQEILIKEISRILTVFKESKCIIKPHFILTGPSGTGKTFTVSTLCQQMQLEFIEVNAAQLTKEGTSGNSLSKVLTPLLQMQGKPVVVFVDEFDKLFIAGNSNAQLAHDTTTGVQNEFLKILEGTTSSVYGDYGKYITISSKNILFVFAGSFNGERDVTLDKLRTFGVKTEFLGRVGLVYNTTPLEVEHLYEILENSELLDNYLQLFSRNKEDVIPILKQYIQDNHDHNTLGARMINTIIHQYFITGGLPEKEEIKRVTFQSNLSWSS